MNSMQHTILIKQTIWLEFFKYCIQLFKNGKSRSMEVEVMNSTARKRREEVCVICEEGKRIKESIYIHPLFVQNASRISL